MSKSPIWPIGFLDIYGFTDYKLEMKGYANPIKYIVEKKPKFKSNWMWINRVSVNDPILEIWKELMGEFEPKDFIT